LKWGMGFKWRKEEKKEVGEVWRKYILCR